LPTVTEPVKPNRAMRRAAQRNGRHLVEAPYAARKKKP
jgi:hypothetical protein